ncbi:MAG: NYN domain-containing protein [Pirellulales bacterium]
MVFDAGQAPWGLARVVNVAGITVHYASNHEDADGLIEELILADSSPKKLTVVSSDHRLHRAAKRRKATPVDSDRWFAQLMRARHERNTTADEKVIKPEGPFTDHEIRFWLKQFGVDPN